MPTYEYACKSCGEHLEVVQSFKDGPLTECPACGGALRKVFGNIGIAFKGSGFYKTDSRSEAKKRALGAAGETSAKKEAAAGEAAGSPPASAAKGDGAAGSPSGSAASSSAASSQSPSSSKVAAAS